MYFGKIVRMATANKISAAPMRLSTLHGSLRMRMPITMAVNGSNAPRMATIVLSMRRRDMVTQMLLSAVGINPSKMMFCQQVAFGTFSMCPSRRMLYAANKNITAKNT